MDAPPLITGWHLDATHPAGVSVAFTVDTPDGPRPVRFALDAVDAEALADDLRAAAHERFSRDDDQGPPNVSAETSASRD